MTYTLARKRLGCATICAFGVSLALLYAQPQLGAPILMKLPRGADSENVEIRYFLTGPFGGYGGYVKQQAGIRSYPIPTSVGGKPGQELKAIAYLPGCAIQTFAVRFDRTRKSELDLHCHHVPSIALRGQLESDRPIDYRASEMIVMYIAHWSHPFFGIMDGAVAQFQIAKSRVNSDGSFAIHLPDFTSVDTPPAYREQASFCLILRNAATWNPIGSSLEFQPELLDVSHCLQIRSSYPVLKVRVSNGSA